MHCSYKKPTIILLFFKKKLKEYIKTNKSSYGTRCTKEAKMFNVTITKTSYYTVAERK